MLYIDMIAFYLQKAGGITVVWKELITRMLRDKCEVTLILQDTPCENIYFKQIMDLNPKVICENGKYTKIKRYLPVNIPFNSESIFVSTYYRIPSNSETKQFTIVHDFTYEYYVKGIRKVVHAWQKKKSVKNADTVVCVSNNTKEDLLKFYLWAKEKQIYVIYNGVNDIYRPLEHKEGIDELGEYNQIPFFLFVGSRASYKRFDFAVDVANYEKKALVIVGGGLLNKQEKRLLHDKLENNYIQLMGVSDETLNKLYNMAEALLYPSEYEGFGIPVIEAQRAGCPVLAYAGSSVKEIVSEDMLLHTLNLEETHNILSKIYSSELRKQGYMNAKRFSWEDTYSQYKGVFGI